jgi:hypothetical protein
MPPPNQLAWRELPHLRKMSYAIFMQVMRRLGGHRFRFVRSHERAGSARAPYGERPIADLPARPSARSMWRRTSSTSSGGIGTGPAVFCARCLSCRSSRAVPAPVQSAPACGSGGPVTVRIWAVPGRIMACVHDTGPGPADPLAGLTLPSARPGPPAAGLWLLHQLGIDTYGGPTGHGQHGKCGAAQGGH